MSYKVEAWPWCADYCKKNKHSPYDSYFWDKAMLEYRRQHNIFEVGDWFVSDAILKPYKIIEKNGDYLKLWCKETTAEFSGNAETLSQIFKNAKHATDAEITAGHRL